MLFQSEFLVINFMKSVMTKGLFLNIKKPSEEGFLNDLSVI